ncbi:MAG: NifU family protein [Gammaproteobacteria bacterium]|nr:NifU family protein [Gammaproteobacteria bacterium]MDE0650271.1 NifU family protein [Gammaproteobacteria bacterium]MXW10885.1 NifU family protein [Gammaproteobacteria bacterium]MYC50680.1 NifU family protein [Gammaproteobacteria bacterium]
MLATDKIEEVLETVRPAIRQDGGDVELIDYDETEGVVMLRLMGACETCPISMLTLREGIERRLKDRVPGVTRVAAV